LKGQELIRSIVKPRSLTQDISRNPATDMSNLIFSRREGGACISRKAENKGSLGEELDQPEQIPNTEELPNVAAPKDDPSDLVEPTVAHSSIILPPSSSDGFLDFDPTEEEGEIEMV
jgi:hypothetical protein